MPTVGEGSLQLIKRLEMQAVKLSVARGAIASSRWRAGDMCVSCFISMSRVSRVGRLAVFTRWFREALHPCVVSILLVAVLFVVSPVAHAVDYVWTDGAGDGLWTSVGNWEDGVVPLNSSITDVYFGDAGTNTVTSVNGTSFQLGILRFSHPRGTVHTIDLDDTTMIIRSEGSRGMLDIGVGASGASNDCGNVVFTNGTLQIGHGDIVSGKFVNLPAAVYIGTTSGSLGPTGRGRATVHGRFVTSNLTAMSIGFVGTGNKCYSSDSWLDLRDTTISSPAGENTWTMSGNLSVGQQNEGDGELRLPASLETMAIGGSFSVGDGNRFTRGIIDFGSNSQFRALTVKGDFSLGAGGSNELHNWPRNVTVMIGTPTKYKGCNIGHGGSVKGADASLIVSNAPFTAFLNDLKVGGGALSGASVKEPAYGLLDLTHATSVQIGDTPNQVDCPSIMVGSGRFYGYGTLRLPATVTAFAADTLIVGSSRYPEGLSLPFTLGTLAFAPGSQLTHFTVRQDFMLGSAWKLADGVDIAGGTGAIEGLPTNVVIHIGAPDAPAMLSIGETYQYGSGSLNVFAPTNGSFSAHLSTLRLGINRRDLGSGIQGTLDLRETLLEDFVVYGSALVGSWTNTASGYSDNRNGQGRLYLPTGDAEIKGSLYLGDAGNNSFGLLDLTGTRIRCDESVEIGKTGTVIVRMQGESAGLDIASTAEDALIVEAGGTIHIDCFAPPSDQKQAYWGLRIAGDRCADLQALVNSGALTWDATALPANTQARFGIAYDERVDKTVVGLLARRSTLIFMR